MSDLPITPKQAQAEIDRLLQDGRELIRNGHLEAGATKCRQAYRLKQYLEISLALAKTQKEKS
jgi:hypothetical protein